MGILNVVSRTLLENPAPVTPLIGSGLNGLQISQTLRFSTCWCKSWLYAVLKPIKKARTKRGTCGVRACQAFMACK